MSDVFSKRKRSLIMSAIRGRDNRTTEWRLRSRLIAFGLSGWKMHVTDLPGKPDFVFKKKRLVVFVDGCYWHGCRKCRSIPTTNRLFWKNKIEGNRKRDIKVSNKLRKMGWKVIHIWEHEIKHNPALCINRIMVVLN